MPDKEGSDDEKSTKSVVNKKQKQMMGEEGYDIARDMGKVKPSKDKKDATTLPVSDEVKKTQKVVKGPSAFERVKAKYGKSVMKVEELDLTQVAEALGGYIVEAPKSNEYTPQMKKNVKRGEDLLKKLTQRDDDADSLAFKASQDKSALAQISQDELKKKITPKRSAPKVTGDSGSDAGGRDRPRITGDVQTTKKRAPRKGVDYFFDPKKAKADREKTVAKRKEYEIDDKGNITDRGVDKYARTMKQSNLPPTQQELDKAKQFAVGGKEVKDSKGNVVGTTTGKYGGRMSKQMSPKNLQKLRSKLKADSKETNNRKPEAFIGDKPPEKPPERDRQSSPSFDIPNRNRRTQEPELPKFEDDPNPSFRKKGAIEKAKEFARKNPVGGYAAVELGKGIIGKLMKIKGAVPGVVGGTVGRRSARGGGGL